MPLPLSRPFESTTAQKNDLKWPKIALERPLIDQRMKEGKGRVVVIVVVVVVVVVVGVVVVVVVFVSFCHL